MENDSNFKRLLLLLFLVFLFCFGFYLLPEQILGHRIRKVDLLSDLRTERDLIPADSSVMFLAENDTANTPPFLPSDTLETIKAELDLRDSLFNRLLAQMGSDTTGSRIEDYSKGHVALRRFFTALDQRDQLGRPVRIAFLGDSFIEGDILVGDLRDQLQERFGGRGVGFVPISNLTSDEYRPTVKNSSKGWKTATLLTDQKGKYTLSGMRFEATDSIASLHLKAGESHPNLQPVSSLRFLYENNENTRLSISANDNENSFHAVLEPAHQQIREFVQYGSFSRVDLHFTETKGLHALGVAMEEENGVVVDNFALRGNTGMLLHRLDSAYCRELNKIRKYDLIILQYGLNIVRDTLLQYGWYSHRMIKNISHLRKCFPESDILLLSVSDRSIRRNGTFKTMPAVLALTMAQRNAANKSGIAFWNTYTAMGGENSMVGYVEKNWAAKDYTHLSFKGGKELASILLRALLEEKKLYESVQPQIEH